ncbi:tetratricopeptide repeat-containing glycosyltransferase family 2 protein [Gemmata sp.]|uniref:tetratricopeptide repeat-containing glycosyltransferase family 2 protein n=1 Tax=Gemmata sp. TaxID=1914242 RepID=UPI003F71B842
MTRPGVSLTMVVRDEASNLGALRALAGVFDEVVVVDTGSTDGTPDVAQGLGARVVHFPWCDSFAAARNEAVRHATREWVFRLDADERVDAGERDALARLLGGLGGDAAGYEFRVRHDLGGREVEGREVRLFRNAPGVRWEYRVHEQIRPAIERAGGRVREAGVAIRHLGYTDAAERHRKLVRNLRLLELDRADSPDDGFLLYYLGASYLELGRAADAVACLERAHAQPALPGAVGPRVYALLAGAALAAGRPGAAREWCECGLRRYPRDAELTFLDGEFRLGAGDAAGAEAQFRAVLGGGTELSGACHDTDLCGYKARHALAAACGPGRPREQEELWRAVLRECPGFLPAWLSLGELYAAEGRWAEVAEAAAAIDRAAPSGPEAAVLRARGLAGRGEHRRAKDVLRKYLSRHPDALHPRLVLAQVLIREGRDWAAAERAVDGVLARQPDHAEAQRLRQLLARRRP